MYDLAGNPLNAKSAMGFHKSVTIEAKKGTKITEMFLDENDKLVAPSSQKYAIMTTEHFKDGTWKETYLNENKQPSCDLPVYEKHMKIDTIWNHSEKEPTFELGINVFSEKSCKE